MYHIRSRPQEYVDEGEEVDDELRDMFYLKKLDRGLFTLQLVDYIIAELCNSNVPQLRKRIYKLMNQKGRSMDELVATLQGMCNTIL
jgi:beta-catenin-like protein 1